MTTSKYTIMPILRDEEPNEDTLLMLKTIQFNAEQRGLESGLRYRALTIAVWGLFGFAVGLLVGGWWLG